MSGEGRESQDEEESSEEERASPAGSDRRHRGSLEREAKSSFDLPDTLQVPGLHRTASGRSSISEHQDCNGKSASGRLSRALRSNEPPLDGDDGDDEGNMVRPPWEQCPPPAPTPTLREDSHAWLAVREGVTIPRPTDLKECPTWKLTSKQPLFSLCHPAEPPVPVMPGAAAVLSLVDMNGSRQMYMNLSWPSPCDSERPITHLSKLMSPSCPHFSSGPHHKP